MPVKPAKLGRARAFVDAPLVLQADFGSGAIGQYAARTGGFVSVD